MANDPLRLVVFDCDGTLVDSQHAIAHCMDHAFAAHDLDCPGLEKTRTIIGLSLPEAIRKLAAPGMIDDAIIEGVTAAYKAAFFELRQTPDFYEPLFPGVREMLAALDTRNWLLGVATARRAADLMPCWRATHLKAGSLPFRHATIIRPNPTRRCCMPPWMKPAWMRPMR